MRTTRALALLALSVLASGVAAAVAVPASSADVRTDTGLGGFSIASNAAPFKVLLDDPTNPLPRPEDSPIVEADPAYSAAYLDTGPASRGIGAYLWPGELLGEGLTQVAPQAPVYPLKAEARYPDKPYVADGQDGGALVRGSALGLDVFGYARANPADVPGTLDVGTASSRSTATVTKDDVAVGTSTSSVSDVSLLSGIIKVGSVATTVTTRSDGRKPVSSGSTVVTGLEIGGVGYVVDDKGARPVGAPVPGTGPLPSGVLDPAKQLGITVDGIVQSSSHDADSATREARGLRITVDTVLLRQAFDALPPQVPDTLYTLFSQVPDPARGFLFYSLSATPKITFILGAGRATSAATLPLTFTPPSFDGFPPLGGLPGGAGTPVTGGSAPIGSGGVPALPTGGTGPAPQTAGPEGTPPQVLAPVAASGPPGNPFSGVSFALLLGAAVVAGFGGWGLLRLQALAFGGGLLGAGCPLGAPSDVPDLRGA